MSRWRFAVLPALIAALSSPPAFAIDLRLEPSFLGQVRDGYWSDETEAPMELYGDFGATGLKYGTSMETYFRLEEDLARQTGQTDFFTGAVRSPGLPGGLNVQLGRQIVADSPIGLWDADSGQIGVAVPNTPLSFNVFGGEPRYWEPTFGPPTVSQNEQIFGGSMRVAQFTGGALSLGYLQQIRQQDVIMQQITLSGTRSFVGLPGKPSLYGNFGFDADRANIDKVRVGMQTSVWKPGLLFNFESGYYKPQDGGNVVNPDLNRREDPIFETFSVSDLLQFRGGMRYAVTPTVSTYADLSYQRYQQTVASFVNGYVYSAGGLYLPGGDGLEMVQLEYYGIDSGGGTVNGGRFSYENRVYEDIVFRANCDVAYYQKATNQSGTAIASLLGVGYMILPGLVAEVDLEANRNQLFPEDYRIGFILSYSAGFATDGGMHQTEVGNQGRPWPWAPTQYGPASWGVTPARWSGTPSLPTGSWAAPALAAAAATHAAQAADEKGSSADGGAAVTGSSANLAAAEGVR